MVWVILFAIAAIALLYWIPITFVVVGICIYLGSFNDAMQAIMSLVGFVAVLICLPLDLFIIGPKRRQRDREEQHRAEIEKKARAQLEVEQRVNELRNAH